MGAGSSGPKYLDEVHTPSGEGFINENQEKINFFIIVFIILLNILIISHLFGKKRYKD
jgi:hypothetical protein